MNRFVKAVCAAGAAFAASMSFVGMAHADDGQVSIQVSGTDALLAKVRVALLDATGTDVAPTSCTSDLSPELLTITCTGLADGAYKAVVVAPRTGIAVTEFCSPADPSLDPEPDGTIRLRPDANVFICTKTVTVTQQSSEATMPSGGMLPALGASWALTALAALVLAVGSGLSLAARRPVR